MESEDALRTKYSLLKPQLDERTLRLCLAAEATIWGYGGWLPDKTLGDGEDNARSLLKQRKPAG